MNKLKVAFVDDLVHKTTSSTVFLEDLLKQRFDVKRFWGSGTMHFPKKNIDAINEYEPDMVLFFQRQPFYPFMRKIKCKNIVFVPMFDQNSIKQKYLIGFHHAFLNLFGIKRIKGLMFSKKDYSIFSKFFDCLSVQYYPKPVKKNTCKDLNVFFWERVETIDYAYVKHNLVNLNNVNSFVLKQSPDPNQHPVERGSKWKLKVVKGWLDNKDYLKLLDNTSVGIAPRLNEGIGHGFLELMARGICVVAHNESTHNEYIVNGWNGVLFDYYNPVVDLSNWREMCDNAYKSIELGYASWLLDKERILNYLEWFEETNSYWWLE